MDRERLELLLELVRDLEKVQRENQRAVTSLMVTIKEILRDDRKEGK